MGGTPALERECGGRRIEGEGRRRACGGPAGDLSCLSLGGESVGGASGLGRAFGVGGEPVRLQYVCVAMLFFICSSLERNQPGNLT
jgi:hypothetical protein